MRKLITMVGTLLAAFFALLSSGTWAAGSATQPSLLPLKRTETVTLAAGCFWGVEEFFRKVPGVTETRVGYTGGKTESPTYSLVSSGITGHAESVEIHFDPTRTSLEQLLYLFFKMHDPTTLNRQGNDKGSQYRSAVFFNNPDQKRVIEKVIEKVNRSGAWKAKLTTEVSPAGRFYPAEEYHQHYLVKNPGGYDNHFLRDISFEANDRTRRK